MQRHITALVFAASSSACARASERGHAPSLAQPHAAASVDAVVVTGVVELSDGSPAADAIVAVNAASGELIAIVPVDDRGHFSTPRPEGRFALTATSPRGGAAFVPPDATATDRLRLRLGDPAAALTIAGTLAVASADLPTGTLMAALRLSDDEGDAFFAPVSSTGTFAILVPPGRYVVRPGTDSLIADTTEVSGVAGERSVTDVRASLRAPPPEAVVDWLGDHALAIETASLRPESDDIAQLAATLAVARVIGVGEATHGTREYFQIKHRLLERLVTHHGVTVLAMEANFSDAERVDAFVQTGEGSVEDAMNGLFTVWRTEEVRELLLWMQRWNAEPKHRQKIHLRGYDVQGTRASMTALRAYLRKVDPSAATEVLEALAPLDAETNERGMIELDEAASTTTQEAIAQLIARLDERRRSYTARSNAAEYALALRHARVLEQARARFVASGPREQFAARDAAMAENVLWLVEQLGPAERMMVWAHNGHVQLDASHLLGANMGSHLRAKLGADYISVGFVLDEGTYRAWVKPNEPVISDVTVGPRQLGWASDAFARVGIPMFAVDLRSAPPGAVREWLFAPHVLHSCGWLVSEWEPKGSPDVLGRLFDVAIYVGRTTSARQLPRRR